MSKVILLSSLEVPCDSIRLTDGREVAVRQIDGVCMQMLKDLQRDDTTLFWRVAERCLPSLSAEEVAGLTLSQARAVVDIACGATAASADAPAAPAES
ncbi:MAG: hypothetical protein ACYC6C_14545 [Coriobacteriia bacterium]